jgi:dihydrofolate synthase/folylpolyglutamate synthase
MTIQFETLDAAYAWLDGHVNLERRLHRVGHDETTFGLERFRRRLEGLGEPQRGLRTIHIAGTRGKGSAALALEALLRAGGQRTAVYTSPHIREYRERVRIDGAPASEDRFRALLERVAAVGGDGDPVGHPTGFRTVFENLTALFFLAAREAEVDWVVVETGLGGRLDATNVLEPGPVLLTRIGLEHMELLGRTRERIAGEKAAILKAGGWGVVGAQAEATADDPGAMGVFRKRAEELATPLHETAGQCPVRERELHREGQRLRIGFEGGELGLDLGLYGTFVAENLQNALGMVAALREKGLVPRTPPDVLREALQNIRLQGRMEPVCGSWPLLADGGHCPTAAAALAASMEAHFGDEPADLLVGMMVDKNHAGFLAELAKWHGWRRVVCYRAPTDRGAPAEDLAVEARRHFDDVKVFTGLEQCLQFLTFADEKRIRAVGTGTLYSVGPMQDWGIRRDRGHGWRKFATTATPHADADPGNP